MTEKLAQAGEGGGERQPPIFTIPYKVAVHAPAERADTRDLFHLYHYVYSVGHIGFLHIMFAVLGQRVYIQSW